MTAPTGLIGTLCLVSGEPIAFADCLACAQSGRNAGCPLPASIVERIVEGIRPPDLAQQLAVQNGAQIGFSVTELLHCPRRHRLAKEHPFHEKMDGLYRMMRGTAVHEFLSQGEAGIKETRLVWTFRFAGRTICLSGQSDLVELRGNGLLVSDYKTTERPPRERSSWICSGCEAETGKSGRGFLCPNCGQLGRSAVYRTVTPVQARSSHAMQLSLYCLLIEKNLDQFAALGAEGDTPILGGEVIYLPPTLPLRIFIPYERERTLAFLKDRLRTLLADDLPPILEDGSEEKWECGYCPLADVCASLP
jgi:CRISPR/Cas system-associated exonuclease Cas4 (RecB family)